MEGKLREEEIADLAKGRLKSKKKEIREALVGYFHDHHRFMIKASLEHIARRMSRRFWGRKMQFIAFVRAKNRAERSPKGVGSIGLVRRSALRGAVQVQSSIRRALGRSAKRSALTCSSEYETFLSTIYENMLSVCATKKPEKLN